MRECRLEYYVLWWPGRFKQNETKQSEVYEANFENQGNRKISANQLVELIVDSNDFSRNSFFASFCLSVDLPQLFSTC